MVRQSVSHYRIADKLGEGGMGKVYLAEDTTLDRKVALKFLPEEMQADDTARKRFLREAKSAAAIDHPFICNIFEIGEADGKAFLAMEYVLGPTLSDKLAAGPLPLKEVLQTAAEIAEALEEAHEKGIVHRDLKPSNIMFTAKGHVKVMDFGLAKRLVAGESQEQTLTALTKEGSTLGTVPYMSPEQLKGESVDTRSDIFSFGIILYKMLAGVHPFKKLEVMETASAILTEDPPPLARYREEVSEVLQHMVRKMLAKQADWRYQLIHEVWTDLGEVTDHRAEPPQSDLGLILPLGRPPETSAPAVGRSWWLAVAGGVVVVGVFAVAYVVLQTGLFQAPSPSLSSTVKPLTSFVGLEWGARLHHSTAGSCT